MSENHLHLYHIVATTAGTLVIGNKNQLPWPKFSEDLKFFKETTTGSTVIMGRKTFESIGRPLPNRKNFVLTRSQDFKAPEGVKVFHSLDKALANVETEKAFIIGGADLYKQTISQVEGIYQTKVPQNYEGDAYYPSIPKFFKPCEEISRALKEKYKIDIVYFENQERSK